MREGSGGQDGGRGGGGRKGEPLIVKYEGEIPPPPIPNTNYASFILNIFAQHGNKTALADADTGKHHTYGDLDHLCVRVGVGLASAGVGAGEGVLLLTPNHIDFPIVAFAVFLTKAVCVPVSPLLTPEELSHVLQVSGAKWAVVHERLVGVLERATSLLSPACALSNTWVLGHASGYTSLAQLMRSKEGKIKEDVEDFNATTTVAMMQFSSGTTGLPKGVLLSHTNLLTSFMQNRYLRENLGGSVPDSSGTLEATLLLLPLCHNYGYNITLNTLSAGGRVVMLPKFSTHAFFTAIQEHKITYAPVVPHLVRHLLQSEAWGHYDLSSLKAIASGSAPIQSHTLQAFMEKSGCTASQGYGMTETCAAVAINGNLVGYKLHAVGRVLPYIEIKVVDLETGETLSEGEEGEVCVRGPSVMLGYTGDPKSTSEMLDSDGWLHTQDLGRLDADGFLFLTDRIKDIIKVKGFQVSPTELEGVLREVEGVGEVAVAGVPSSRYGEVPRAWVVPRDGSTLNPQHLQEYVTGRVSSHKQLSGGVELVKELPKNDVGKVVRRKLREKYLAMHSKL